MSRVVLSPRQWRVLLAAARFEGEGLTFVRASLFEGLVFVPPPGTLESTAEALLRKGLLERCRVDVETELGRRARSRIGYHPTQLGLDVAAFGCEFRKKDGIPHCVSARARDALEWGEAVFAGVESLPPPACAGCGDPVPDGVNWCFSCARY